MTTKEYFFALVALLTLNAHADLKVDLAQPAAPLDLSAQYDMGQAVSEMITAVEGGRLTLVDTRGNQFDFWVEPNALMADTFFTLVPITDLGRSEFKKALAVKILPEGTNFKIAAHLKITPAESVELKNILPFSFFGDGQDTHLATLTADRDVIEIRLLHLSGYGALFEPGLRDKIIKSWTRGTEERLSNRLNEQILLERSGHIPRLPLDFMAEQLKIYLKEVVQYRLDRMTSCGGGSNILDQYMGVLRQAQLLGLNDFAEEHLYLKEKLLTRVSYLCNDIFYQACMNEHKWTDFIQYGLSVERYFRLTDENPNDWNFYADLISKARRCLHFDLDFISRLINHIPRHMKFEYEMKTKALIKFEDSFMLFKSQSNLEATYMQAEHQSEQCSEVQRWQRTTPFEVAYLDLFGGTDYEHGKTREPLRPGLGFWVKGATAGIELHCHTPMHNPFTEYVPAPPDHEGMLWGIEFYALHGAMHDYDGNFMIRDWDRKSYNTEVVLYKKFSGNTWAFTTELNTEVSVKHTPKP